MKIRPYSQIMAEEEGFEPTCPFGTPVFKTGEPPLLNSSWRRVQDSNLCGTFAPAV